MRRCSFLLLALVLAACGSSGTGVPLSYDPPGSTITTDKPITLQERQTYAFEDAGVWFTNDFEGGRISRLTQESATAYTVHIHPENAPVNNSAWYAFKAWAAQAQTVQVTLSYEDGTHRYVPKLSTDGQTWMPIAADAFQHDTTNGTATLTLTLGPEPLWVAGQELITSSVFDAWGSALAEAPYVHKRTIGASRQGRSLHMLEITASPDPTNYVLVISRQHPPEVTGSLGVMAFLETVAGESGLAQRFRSHFAVWAVPLVNPDGVDNGHWRHNTGGVDLNRDWAAFNQPETRTVRDTFLQLNADPRNKVFFGLDFHSTQEDVFYTLDRTHTTRYPTFIDRWLDGIGEAVPGYVVNDDPSGLGSPVSKNWFYEHFDVPPVTYEVGDEADRTRIRQVAEAAAHTMMALLLEEIGQ